MSVDDSKCIDCGSAAGGQQCDKCDYPLCDACAAKAPSITLRGGTTRGPLCRDCAEALRKMIQDEEAKE